MSGVLQDNTSEQCASLAALAAHSCHGEQRSSRPTDARDSPAIGHHAIPGLRCTPRRSTAFGAGFAMSAPDAWVTLDATMRIMWIPTSWHHPIPAPKIGFSTATPHKTMLQIMRPAGDFGYRRGLPVRALVEWPETRITVGLQEAAECSQVRTRTLAPAIGRVAIHDRWRGRTTKRPLIAQVHPQPAGLGLAGARC